MRPAFYLLLVLLSCWQARSSARLDPGSGGGPDEDSHGSSSIGASSTVRAVAEGSGDNVPGGDDEDSVAPSSVTTAVTTTSAATSSASRSVVTTIQASDGGDDEGSGTVPVRHHCDSGTTELSPQCYCVDEANKEIPGTRGRTNCKPVDEEPIVPHVAVTYGRSVSPSFTSTRISTGEIVIDEDSTTVSVPSPAATSSVPITTHTSAAAVQTTTVTMTTAASTTTVPSTLATTTTTMPPPTTAVVTTAVSTRTATLQPTVARHAPSSTVRHVHTQPTTTLSNDVPYYAVDKDAAADKEAKEESDNQINAAAEPLNRGASHESSGGLHPGLLAAIIGGGVVGLLCAILLIMFIVYRMRKKDEGSYPLDDGKPRAPYKSPPSKEFYA